MMAKRIKDGSSLTQLPLKRTPKPISRNKLKELSYRWFLVASDILIEAEARSNASTSYAHVLDLND